MYLEKKTITVFFSVEKEMVCFILLASYAGTERYTEKDRLTGEKHRFL